MGKNPACMWQRIRAKVWTWVSEFYTRGLYISSMMILVTMYDTRCTCGPIRFGQKYKTLNLKWKYYIVYQFNKRIHSFFFLTFINCHVSSSRSDMQPCDTTQLYLARRTEASLSSKTLWFTSRWPDPSSHYTARLSLSSRCKWTDVCTAKIARTGCEID